MQYNMVIIIDVSDSIFPEEELRSGENKLFDAALKTKDSVAGQFDVLVFCSSHRCACN